MGTKQSLLKANKIKDDEFFTLWDDIANEVALYKEQLKGKRILCSLIFANFTNNLFCLKSEYQTNPIKIGIRYKA